MTTSLEEGRAGAEDIPPEPQHFFDDVLLALRRHRWLIAITATLGFASGIAGVVFMVPRYTAEALIMLEARQPRVTDLPSIISELVPYTIEPQLRSEVQLLESEGLYKRVVEELGLQNQPEFMSDAAPPIALLNTMREWLVQYTSPVRSMPANDGDDAEPDRKVDAELARALNVYKRHFMATADGRSYVIALQFQSRNPRLAARILNKHVELYLADQVAYKRAVGKQAAQWLSEEIVRLQDRLKQSQEVAQRFREENNIVLTGGMTLLSQRVAAANAQLPAAVQDRVSREAQSQQIHRLLRGGAIDSESQILGSRTIEQLRAQEGTLVAKLGELRAIYGPQHPAIAKVNAQLDDLRRSISDETARIAKGVENDLAAARDRETKLRQQLTNLERETIGADRAEAKLRDLEREVTANRSLLETLLTRYKQIGAQEGAQVPDARIISRAGVPDSPSFPRLRSMLPASLSIGALIGVALAFCIELTQRCFRGSREVESEFAFQSLGSLPLVPRQLLRAQRPEDCVLDRPRSAFAEAIRYIRNCIQTVPLDIESPRVFLVTSSLPNEGKSVLAVALARSFARSGHRALLIDGDLRNPSVCRLLGTPDPPSDLAMVLSGQATLTEAVHSDSRSTLDFIASKPSNMEPQDMLSSRHMGDILKNCARHYDVVIIDSPPITPVSDALILARHADATILVVRWGRTHREIARASLTRLFANGARICGIVLSQVDIRKGVFSPHEPEYYHKLNRVYYRG
jgi:polysaccharide biosynthesis transport protein